MYSSFSDCSSNKISAICWERMEIKIPPWDIIWELTVCQVLQTPNGDCSQSKPN